MRRAFSPLILTIAIAPAPAGVDMAAIVSIDSPFNNSTTRPILLQMSARVCAYVRLML